MEPLKDPANEHPVPVEWRDTFKTIVNRFVKQDYQLTDGVDGVRLVAEDTANQIAEYIDDYGETLIPLSESTWESSVMQWMGDHWVVLVDLCTEAEGISDLVLHSIVTEEDCKHRIEVHMVYVP